MVHQDRAGWRVSRHAWLVLAAGLLPAVAIAQQGPDELAATIEQSLATIEFRLDIRPQQAVRDLEEQQRKLELLEQQAPDHPAVPKLRSRLEELRSGAASGLADAASGAAIGDAAGQIPSAPEEFETGLQEVRDLQSQAEAEYLRGRPDEAVGYLEQAEAQMGELERRYQDEIPPGHASLIVAKERMATLKDHLADAGTPTEGSSDTDQ